MTLFAVGRLCVKIAGRDAGRKCLIVEQIDNNYVLVDGDVRRKKVNLRHLEPLAEIFELKKGASHEEVKRVMEEKGLPVWEHNSKSVSAKPIKKRKVKSKAPAQTKLKKVSKKEVKAEQEE